MSVLMRPSLLFRQENVKLLRCLGAIRKLELSKVIQTRFIVSDSDHRDNVLDLIDLYPKVGPLGFALHNDCIFEVLLLFKSIASIHGESRLSKEHLSRLQCCSHTADGYPSLSRQCHGYLLKSGLLLHRYVKAALVRVYTMLSDVVGAIELLHCKPGLDTRRYTLILVGVVEKGCLDEALFIFRRFMMSEDAVWNKDTYIGVFGLCARLKDLNLGRQVHNKLLKSSDVAVVVVVSVCNAVMKMYGKCKDVSSARKVFDRCEYRNVVIWTTMLAAYSEHRSLEDSLKLFLKMQHEEDVFPNKSTFSIMLSVSAELCSMRSGSALHALAAKTGFEGVKKVDNALMNMYRRTGDTKAAEKVVFLGTTYKNREYGVLRVAKLFSDDVATKVSKRRGVTQVHELMETRAWSWVEIGDKTCTFTSVRKGDPKFVSIHSHMKPFLACIHTITNKHDEDMEDVLKGDRDAYHSVEIAVGYALFNTHNHARICIIKESCNTCVDCHTLVKLASKVFKNTLITVRDAYHFHNFRNGHCSCRDYYINK